MPEAAVETPAVVVLRKALNEIFSETGVEAPARLVIEAPKDAAHGDLATNAALLLAKSAKMPPKELASRFADRLPKICPDILKAEAAGPGFCNVTLKPEFWQKTVSVIEEAAGAYGHSQTGAGKKALVEYVSANPTGPLHVGHGRGAAVGDSVARLLRAAGFEVETEYYLNDAGRQMRLLGQSIWLRAKEARGAEITFPEDCYKGDYIRELAKELLEKTPEISDMPEDEARAICQQYGMERILGEIREDLARFRCEHQRYFSEKSLVEAGAVDKSFAALANAGHSYESEGALWFNSTPLGDDRDRVLRKSDDSLTYFATDIAYHHDKFVRGNDWLIDVWGADHHGYIARMKAAIAAMGENPEKFNVILIQLVNLLKDGEIISMSTRAGKFATLKELMDEVGVDAARFLFLSRSSDSPLDFDLDLARSRSLENPVYYVQYAHARVHSLLARAAEKGFPAPAETAPENLRLLNEPEEIALLRKLAAWPAEVANAAMSLAPHHITRYLNDLAGLLHAYYSRHTVINPENAALSLARLGLSRASGQVLANGLFLLGVTAPESM